MPEYAPAPQENPYLPALKEETLWWLREGGTVRLSNYSLLALHQARLLENLRAAVRYEKDLYERTRDIHLEGEAERIITGALYQFIRRPAPEWQVQPEVHWKNARDFVATLPKRLDTVWEWSGRPRSLSGATIYNWLEQHISTICPYVCPA